MDKVITTAILSIAAVLAAVMVINAMLPALGESGSSVLSSSTAASEIIKTDTEIVVVATLSTEIYVWVKNVGSLDITEIDSMDVFLEVVGTGFTRMTYDTTSVTNNCTASPASTNQWLYCYEDGETLWNPTYTIRVIIELGSTPSGDYKIQIVTGNGVSAEKSFSV